MTAPALRLCPRCHGEGLDHTRGDKDGTSPLCATCGGSGEVPVRREVAP
jgi:DnaJ-class molecular chaperone